ncbi:26S proteasome non-ATPase regulatory subunit 10, partial [Penaeus vannamei]
SQPLHVAAGKGHREIVEALLAGGADPNAQDRKGIGPLVMAAKEGHREVVEMLLAGGADPNARVGFGFFSKDSRALHVAAKKGHKEVVEALLAGDADPNAQDEEVSPPSLFCFLHPYLPFSTPHTHLHTNMSSGISFE